MNVTTRVDFHTNVPDKLAYACRLARKAYMAGNKVVVLAADSAQMQALNAAMWTISPTDFVPHVLAGDPLAAHTPVVLTDSEDRDVPHHDILVNLSLAMPANYDQYQRRRAASALSTTARPVWRPRTSWQANHERPAFRPWHTAADGGAVRTGRAQANSRNRA